MSNGNRIVLLMWQAKTYGEQLSDKPPVTKSGETRPHMQGRVFALDDREGNGSQNMLKIEGIILALELTCCLIRALPTPLFPNIVVKN